jgi:hypothetical protein
MDPHQHDARQKGGCGTATAAIVIDRVSGYNNGQYGVILSNVNGGAATAGISNSIAGVNGASGYYFSNVAVSLDASYAHGNSDGVLASSGTLALGRNVLTGNSHDGLSIGNASVNSYKDNRIAGNGTQLSSTPGTATLY